jgi:hypothetical protein
MLFDLGLLQVAFRLLSLPQVATKTLLLFAERIPQINAKAFCRR